MKKIFQNRLKVAKKKVHNKWYDYSVSKARILVNDDLSFEDKKKKLSDLIKTTRQNISFDYESYQSEKKELRLFGRLSPYEDFKFSKTHTTPHTIQKTFHTGKNYDTDKLDDLFDNIFKEPNVEGIAIVFKVIDEETEAIHFVSEYITKGLLERMKQSDTTVYDQLVNKLEARQNKSDQYFQIIDYYIRIIYAKPKSSKK